MARLQTQRKSKSTSSRYYTDFIDQKRIAVLPPQFGRGANIRLVTQDGTTLPTNPRIYKRLGRKRQQSLVGSICSALNIPTEQTGA